MVQGAGAEGKGVPPPTRVGGVWRGGGEADVGFFRTLKGRRKV